MFGWDRDEPCPHPTEIGPSQIRAKPRLIVRLQNGTEVEVCRLCWAVVATKPGCNYVGT